MGDLLYPAVPDPIATTESLLESVIALKENIELLTGSRKGNGTAKAVTAGDLATIFTPASSTGGTPQPIDFTDIDAALAVAQAAVQGALNELEDVINTSTEELQNEQQQALTEFQLLLDEEEGLRIDGDNMLQVQIDTIILTNNEGAIAAITVETAARITADTALAGQLTSLSAVVDGNAAAIANEVLVRADADSALATQISSITAIASGQHVFVQSTPPVGTISAPLTIGDIWIDTANGNLLKVWDGSAWVAHQDAMIGVNAAAISTEQIARADADTAIANQINTLFATVSGNTALITQEQLVRATADEALAVEINTLSVQTGGNTAAITTEAAVRANADSALSGQITTLQAQTANNAAAIVAESVARTDGDDALAANITTLTATVVTIEGNVDDNTLAIAANTANITNESIVRATADDAFAAQIATLTTSSDNASAAISQEAATRAANDNAIASNVSNLTATVQAQGTTISQNTAAITNEQTARANADTAIANSVTTLSSTVDGHTATIISQGTSINGLMAEYSLTLNVNGHITGFRINNDSLAGSQFIVQADTFKIVSGAGGTQFTPFTVTGPNVFINRVVIADEIISAGYAVDGSGNPAEGFRFSSDGLIRAEDARFTDFAARGGNFTERPVILATPNFRNGVPDNLCTGIWNSPGNIVWSPSLAWATMSARFHRTPEAMHAQFIQVNGSAQNVGTILNYFVPPGRRLPPKIVGDLSGNTNTVEWRDDGTIVRIQYDGNGAISTSNTALGWWIYDVEIDPLNLALKTKMFAGLGFSRYPQPLRVPDGITSIAFKVWGAGGAKDDGGAIGGPGGYVAGTFAVGTKSSSALIKHGDMLWLLPGEGGKSKTQDIIMGFGGRGQAQERRASGGGLSGVFRNSITIANALLIAGGGGGAEGGQAGGPGGATLSGSNGVSGADDDIMTGLPWAFTSSVGRAGGGGGRVGGGYLTASGSNAGGRGGTNFTHANATSVTSSSSAVSGNGNATTALPPNAADADYVAKRYCLGNAADVGEGKTSTDILETGGNGLIVVSFI